METETKDLTAKLNTLSITQPSLNPDDQEKRQRRRSSGVHKLVANPTLASLSMEAKNTLEEVLRSGLHDEAIPEDEAKVDVVRWRDNLDTPTKPKICDGRAATLSGEQRRVSGLKPLGRTLSMEERETFLGELAHASLAASVFSLDIQQAEAVQQTARKIGLYVCAVKPKNQTENGPMCWLVLGNNEEAVKRLAATLDGGVLPKGLQTRKWAIAGGSAMAGALATWTSLALA